MKKFFGLVTLRLQKKQMQSIKGQVIRILRRHSLLTMSLLFLIFRLPFLTKIPIFNDESIYLDWGNRMIQGVVRPFYPLYDG